MRSNAGVTALKDNVFAFWVYILMFSRNDWSFERSWVWGSWENIKIMYLCKARFVRCKISNVRYVSQLDPNPFNGFFWESTFSLILFILKESKCECHYQSNYWNLHGVRRLNDAELNISCSISLQLSLQWCNDCILCYLCSEQVYRGDIVLFLVHWH